jgi:TM2 domain-containing membrane protein YozV
MPPVQMPQAPYPGPPPQQYYTVRKDKVTAGLLALLLGGTGAHHFYLGNPGIGVAYLLVWLSGALMSFIYIGLLWVWIPGIFALIDGIMYLTKPEDQFQRNYHNWFCSGP